MHNQIQFEDEPKQPEGGDGEGSGGGDAAAT